MTFLGSLECTVHVMITPLYDHTIVSLQLLEVIKHMHVHTYFYCIAITLPSPITWNVIGEGKVIGDGGVGGWRVISMYGV